MIRTGPITFLLPLALAILGALTVAARGTRSRRNGSNPDHPSSGGSTGY